MKTSIITPTRNLSDSVDFYEKLNFNVSENDGTAIVTSKDLLIEIDSNRYIRAGLKLYRSDWSDQVAELSKFLYVTQTKDYYLFSDTNGVWIYLVNGENTKDSSQLHELAAPFLGNYAGLSLESTDVAKTLAIYELLGFQKSAGDVDQGWLTIQNDDKVTISIMKPNSCPHLFFNPSLTFFNGSENLKIIQKIRNLGIEITEEITHFNKDGIVDNIIIRDPGGFGFFIFND